jgi:hypothetical protein
VTTGTVQRMPTPYPRAGEMVVLVEGSCGSIREAVRVGHAALSRSPASGMIFVYGCRPSILTAVAAASCGMAPPCRADETQAFKAVAAELSNTGRPWWWVNAPIVPHRVARQIANFTGGTLVLPGGVLRSQPQLVRAPMKSYLLWPRRAGGPDPPRAA